METIQVVLDTKLLRATDTAATRAGLNRSALIREALRQHLKRGRIQALEARDRQGYIEHPDGVNESETWEREAAWPEP